MVTYFVVQAYQKGKNGYLIPDEAKEVPSDRYAVALCHRLMCDRAAVIAFSRTGDPATGEWADAEIIYREGDVSDEMLVEVA